MAGWLRTPIPAICSASICRRPSGFAKSFRAQRIWSFGQPVRRRSATRPGFTVALALQAGESACVCDLAWIVGRDERLVSHHVRLLKAAGLARSERDGKMVMYELTERGRALLAAVAAQGIAA